MRSRTTIGATACALALLLVPAAAQGSKQCAEPVAGDWEMATAPEAGMDEAKLRDAIDYATANGAAAVRVYRDGCRVGEDDAATANREVQFQSWSLAKSITALVFGRAMTLNLVGPDDPLGSLVPEADAAHGEITTRNLLTMTSGLRWNGLRDYNIFMPDRVREGLTVPLDKEPGTYWEYSQSGTALLAEATENATGEDFQAFAQRELFSPLGIEPGSWRWGRDNVGHTQGFFDLHMRADDFARLGELLRRGGIYDGRRLLSKRVVRESISPVAQSGCYGWMIWLNASRPCVGPRVVDRPVSDERYFPTLPADAYQYAGLFGQLVTVFPSQGLIIARFGNDSGTIAGGAPWEEDFYGRVLRSITDEPIKLPKPDPDSDAVGRDDVDRGFFESLSRPDEILQGESPPPLPAAGPARARATLIKFRAKRPGPKGQVKMRLRCPRVWPSGLTPRCKGKARLSGARGSVRYRIRGGKARTVSFPLRPALLRKLERRGKAEVVIKTRNRDRAGGTVAKRSRTLKRRNADRR